MHTRTPVFLAAIALMGPTPVFAADLESLRQELTALRADYETRIAQLEAQIDRLAATEARLPPPETVTARSANAFNPAISLVLDGSHTRYEQDPADWEIPGLPLGGEAGLAEEGLGVGHTELAMSANIDDKFYGKLTLAVDEHDGELEVELEEAFFQTLGLGAGFTLRGGRFFSAAAYLNQQHDHAWDFADAPLVYAGLFGNKLIDDGVRLSWVAPTDLYLELGLEALRGSRFPGGGEQTGAGARVAFLTVGGDVGMSHSWQGGLSFLERRVTERGAGGHAHGGNGDEGHDEEHDDEGHEGDGDDHEEEGEAAATFSGDSDIVGASFVYKWAPSGYGVERNFELQAEYFRQQDRGDVSHGEELAGYRGDHTGYYVQGVYQFTRGWRFGLRYDYLDPEGRGDPELLEEAGLLSAGFTPRRYSAMLEWIPSEFSRVRLQYNRDRASPDRDHQWLLQYTFSIGDHRAHAF